MCGDANRALDKYDSFTCLSNAVSEEWVAA